jgi:hypothetical protein
MTTKFYKVGDIENDINRDPLEEGFKKTKL